MPKDEFIAKVKRKYDTIMNLEEQLSIFTWTEIPDSEDMYGVSIKVLEIAKNSHVERAFNYDYGLAKKEPAIDSSGSHANLLSYILDQVISYKFGWDHEDLPENYTYRGIMEAARRITLPENYIGNFPDNGTRDNSWLRNAEHSFNEYISRYAPSWEAEGFEQEVNKNLYEFEKKSTLIGEMLYLSEKTASIIEALCLDREGRPPIMKQKDILATSKDRREMELCDEKAVKYRHRKGCRASEMWSIGYFQIGTLIDYDSTSFFTALIVMSTLLCHNAKWYSWRTIKY